MYTKKQFPWNGGLTIEFYQFFWHNMKDFYRNSINYSQMKKEFSVSQKQVIIKLIEKIVRLKGYVKNWCPVILLNVDYKIDLKAFSTRIKIVLPSLVSIKQTAYVNNIFIGETGRLISDIVEVMDIQEMDF